MKDLMKQTPKMMVKKTVKANVAPKMDDVKKNVLKESNMKQPKPLKVKMSIKDVLKKADSLMNKSYDKKSFANEQIRFGKAAIKAGNANKTQLLDLKGTTSPTAKVRIDNANKMKQSAKIDSLTSVKLKNQIKKK